MILPLRVFGRAGAHWIASGAAMAPISLRTHSDQFLAQRLGGFFAQFQSDVGVDALALDVMREADHSGLGHLRMSDERRYASAVSKQCPCMPEAIG